MTDEKPTDTTAALMLATANWISEAMNQATPQGRILAAQSMAREAADLTVVLELKSGTAKIFAISPGRAPVWLAQASLTPLTPADVAAVAPGPDTLQ